MIFHVSLTKYIRKPYQPKLNQVKSYIRKSLIRKYNIINISVSIVTSEASRQLNLQYRNRDYSTNVISLEDRDAHKQYDILQGELILCDEVIVNEAGSDENIPARYAHMLVHGALHLQGLDHLIDDEAEHMEKVETTILNELGFANPYD